MNRRHAITSGILSVLLSLAGAMSTACDSGPASGSGAELAVDTSSRSGADMGAVGQDRIVRIGTYDNRAIAVAYAASRFNPVAEKMKDFKAAEEAGDEQRIAELENWGESHQRQLHRQGFGHVPVDDLLAHVADRLPEVAEQAGVEAIVFDPSWAGPNVELVDVSMQIVMLYEPTEKTLRHARAIMNHEPADLDEIERNHDH